jgi:hypothetical protein
MQNTRLYAKGVVKVNPAFDLVDRLLERTVIRWHKVEPHGLAGLWIAPRHIEMSLRKRDPVVGGECSKGKPGLLRIRTF